MKKTLLLTFFAIITAPCTLAMEKETQPDLFAQLPRELHKEFVINLLGTHPSAIENLKTLQKLMLTSKQKAALKNLFENLKNVTDFCFALKNTTENIFRSLYLLKVYKFITEEQYTKVYNQFVKDYPKEFEAFQEDEFEFIGKFGNPHRYSSKNLSELREWINKGINVNSRAGFSAPVLISASSNNPDVEAVKLLLGVPGIDVNAIEQNKGTALMYASERGHIEIVRLLLATPGIDVNFQNLHGESALMLAVVLRRNDEVVKLLLAAPGIDVNSKDYNNDTALMKASAWGRVAVVQLLLAAPGIDVNIKNKDGKTALVLASDAETKKELEAFKNKYLSRKYLPWFRGR